MHRLLAKLAKADMGKILLALLAWLDGTLILFMSRDQFEKVGVKVELE